MKKCVERQCIFFRTYGWHPAAISIGFMQRLKTQLDLSRLQENGIDWIRRPTGGRAVLHANDITYSFIAPRNLPETGTAVETTYAVIMRILVAGFRMVGIDPEIQDSSDPLIRCGRHVKLPCFLAPNRNEIMIDGKKLVGSAQYRSNTAVLQHGSIPMTPESSTLPSYLLLEPHEKEMQQQLLRKKSISITQINTSITRDALCSALHHGFSSTIKYGVVTEVLHDAEIAEIEHLMSSDSFKQHWLTDPCD